MAFKKRRNYRRRPRRRRRRGYSSANKRLVMVRPRGFLFGNAKVVKLKYVFLGQIPINIVTGNPSGISFRANGPQDPFVGIGAGQPRGWDQMETLYRRYTVTNSKIKCRFIPEGVGAPGPHHPIVLYNEQSNETEPLFLDARAALENRTVSARPWASGQGALGCTISRTYNAKRWWKVVDPLDEHRLGSFTTTVPIHQVYWHLSFTPTHGGEALSPVDVMVEIDYTIVYTEPINPPAS